MKRNIGVLPMNETYEVISVDYDDSDFCCCANCGKAIKNVVTLKNSSGTHIGVGTDCAETLGNADISNYWAYQDMVKKNKRFVAALWKIAKLAKTGNFTVMFCFGMGLYVYSYPNVSKWHPDSVVCDRNISPDRRTDFINAVLARYVGKVTFVKDENPEEHVKSLEFWKRAGVKGLPFN